MGVYPDRFWASDFSFEDIAIIFEGEQHRSDRWHELGLFIAWHVESFSRMKTLPAWDTVKERFQKSQVKAATPIEKVQKQPYEHMKAMMQFVGTNLPEGPIKAHGRRKRPR